MLSRDTATVGGTLGGEQWRVVGATVNPVLWIRTRYPRQFAEEFGRYICRKIERIGEYIDNIAVVSPFVEERLPEVKLEAFPPLLTEEDHKFNWTVDFSICLSLLYTIDLWL